MRGRRKEKKSLQVRRVRILACVLFAAGAGVFVFPHISQWLYDRNARAEAEEFVQRRKDLSEEKEPFLPELYERMQEYNKDLYENGQTGFRDAWSYQTPSFDLTEWGLPDNMVGYIDIPKMEVTLPLYLGANEENMTKGAVHLSQTSLPIGGENTNCVIAAHRGYSKAAMFRDIEKLEIGDEIRVTNLWETLTYQVAETKVILPEETEEVLIQEGRDLVTLITCHPYRHNYQRYVVYCERVEPGLKRDVTFCKSITSGSELTGV